MLDTPRITVFYTVVSQGPITPDHVSRFVGSWLVNPPGVDCDLVAICNGGPPTTEVGLMLGQLNCKFFPRQNDDGWDVSGFQDAARKFDCQMGVFLGESVYFWKQDWLAPVVDAWKKYGEGLYGFFSSFLVRPHMNTTAFACSPRFLLGWPQVKNHPDRYNFEHGQYSFWKRVAQFGKPTKLVTADGCYDPPQWRYPKNRMWSGDQSNCLIRCNHTDRYDAAETNTKRNWEMAADGIKPNPHK